MTIRAHLWLLFLALTATSAAAQPVRFRLADSYPIGGDPATVAIGDFNNDENMDAVSANFDVGTITMLLGDGMGGFTVLDDAPASAAPLQLQPLFANDDEFLDLLASEGESDFIYLLRGNGDGTFAEAETIDSGHDPYGFAVADMDKDGKIDVVQTTAGEGAGRVNVLLGDGMGGFALDQMNRGRALNASSFGVVLGDFNEDEILDVAATSLGRPTNCDLPSCGTLNVMLGDGTGGINRPFLFPTGAAPFPVASADLDHDGHLDLVTGDVADDRISVFKGSGDGGFVRGQRVTTGITPSTIQLVDYDGDGWLEAVVANARSNDISLVQGLPGGDFGRVRNFIAGQTVLAGQVADFNEDLRLDFVAVSRGDLSPVTSFLFGMPGGFTAVESLLPTTDTTGAAAGDVSGDGVPDVLFGVASETHAAFFARNAGEPFAAPVEVTTGIAPGTSVLRDLNGDGRADLVAAAVGSGRVAVLLAGAEGFGAPALLDVAGPPSGLAVADLDADGKLDIATVNNAPAAARSLSVLFGLGGGAFEAAVSRPLTGLPLVLTTGDFNQDGIADLAAGNAQENSVTLTLGDRERTLGGAPLAVNAPPAFLACADFDHDGLDDLAVGAAGSGTVRLHFGTGASGFTPGGQVSFGGMATAMIARDVTGDLHADLLATLQGTVRLVVAASRGDRSFDPPEPFDLGLRPAAIAVADFDADGRYDVAVSGTNGWVLTSEAETSDRQSARADANGDDLVSAGDLMLLNGELARGVRRIEDIGPPVRTGADANGDGVLDAADVRRVLAAIFG